MLRFFLPLYLILAVFFSVFVAAVIYLPDILLEDKVAYYEERVTRGTLYLLEQELKGLSLEQQQQKLKTIRPHFGFPLQLLKKRNSLLDQKSWAKVIAGQFVNPIIDDAEYYFKRIATDKKNQFTVLAVAFSDSRSILDNREAMGTYYLVTKLLSGQAKENWPVLISELQTHFGIPVSLKELKELKLPPDKMNLLQQGKKIALEHDTNQWHFLGKIENTSSLLQFGPITQPMTMPVLFTIIIGSFIISLGLAIFFWIRPLWISVNELSQAADEFGQGKLYTRAIIKPNATLGKLASQFNAMADRIGGLIRDHRELTNSVSHELRTPIARMHFELEILRNMGDLARYPSVKKNLNGLNLDVNELEGLVNELLYYARFEKMEHPETLQDTRIIPWLEELIEYARGYSGDMAIAFINHNVPEKQIVNINTRSMSRVVHNLLRNACRYGKHMVIINLNIHANKILIHVDDDGHGIPEKYRSRVFKAFSRIDESRTRQSGGHGLGLAIVKKVVEAHKGRIVISASSLGGARFTVTLPVQRAV